MDLQISAENFTTEKTNHCLIAMAADNSIKLLVKKLGRQQDYMRAEGVIYGDPIMTPFCARYENYLAEGGSTSVIAKVSARRRRY